jgi:hypothetical protein
LNKVDTCRDCKDKEKKTRFLEWIKENEINLDGTYFINSDWLRKWIAENEIK